MASTRALILWLLDHGHQPQILQMDMAVGTEDWVAAVTAEYKALQQNSDQSISQEFLDQLNELGLNPISAVESSKAINPSVDSIWKEHAQASGDLSEKLREILEQAITLRGQGDNEKSLKTMNDKLQNELLSIKENEFKLIENNKVLQNEIDSLKSSINEGL